MFTILDLFDKNAKKSLSLSSPFVICLERGRAFLSFFVSPVSPSAFLSWSRIETLEKRGPRKKRMVMRR